MADLREGEPGIGRQQQPSAVVLMAAKLAVGDHHAGAGAGEGGGVFGV
ncbi:MAG: hypothetical protein WDM81_21245 [Rhizomicrobium sp.]